MHTKSGLMMLTSSELCQPFLKINGIFGQLTLLFTHQVMWLQVFDRELLLAFSLLNK